MIYSIPTVKKIVCDERPEAASDKGAQAVYNES